MCQIDNCEYAIKKRFENSLPLALLTKSMLCCAVLALSACEQSQLPPGAALSISPETRSINIVDRIDEEGRCLVDPGLYIDQPIVLTMVNSDGAPMGNVDVKVYVDFSGNTYPGPPVLALYDDRRGNNNGIVDDFELVSGVGDDIATVRTDYYGGDRPLLLRINVSCPFKGDVFAFSDGVSATSAIELIVGSTDGSIQ